MCAEEAKWLFEPKDWDLGQIRSIYARKAAVASTPAQQCVYIVTTAMAMAASKSHKCEYLPIRVFICSEEREKKTRRLIQMMSSAVRIYFLPLPHPISRRPSLLVAHLSVSSFARSLACFEMPRKNSLHNLIAVCRGAAFCFTISY